MQKSGYATKKEANNARNIAITELHNGTFVVNCNVNVKQFFTYWLEKVMRPSILTSDSYDAYKNIVYNHIIPSLGTLKMTPLSRSHIQKFYNEKTQYSHNVAKLCKAVMNTALKYALEKKLVKFNAALDIELPKCVKKKKYRTIEIDTKKIDIKNDVGYKELINDRNRLYRKLAIRNAILFLVLIIMCIACIVLKN